MNKSELEHGALFSLTAGDHTAEYMLAIEKQAEGYTAGNVFQIVNGQSLFVGEFLWGMTPEIFITSTIFPGHQTTVAILKRDLKKVGVFGQTSPIININKEENV